MQADNPLVLDILQHSMVARIATISHNGRPSVNPLYFIYRNGEIWLGTPEWTLAARNAKADPRVSVLFNVEQDSQDPRILRIRGQARVTTDQAVLRAYSLPVARKYILTPGGLYNWLTHPRQIWLRRTYTAQSHEKGRTGVIIVTPQEIELLGDGLP